MITGLSIKNTLIQKLFLLFQFLRRPDVPAILHQCDDDYTHTNCVLGFCRLEVQQPLFYQKIDELIRDSSLWRCKDTKNIYTIFRQIGVRQKKYNRGPKERESSKNESMYSTLFYFCPISLSRNKHSLATGSQQKRSTPIVKSSMSLLPLFEEQYGKTIKFNDNNIPIPRILSNDVSHPVEHVFDQTHIPIKNVANTSSVFVNAHLAEKIKQHDSVLSVSVNSPKTFESIQYDAMEHKNVPTNILSVLGSSVSLNNEAGLLSTASLDTTSAVDALLSLSSLIKFVPVTTVSNSRIDSRFEIDNTLTNCGINVLDNISSAEKNGKINMNSSNRLKALYLFIEECLVEGLVTVEKQNDHSLECILGWSSLHVSNPRILNDRIKQMVEDDHGGIWKKANGKINQTLKNPTLGVYELFRKIGVKPKKRGSILMDPGASDMFYYKEWKFINDKSFQHARSRLVPGYKFHIDKSKP